MSLGLKCAYLSDDVTFGWRADSSFTSTSVSHQHRHKLVSLHQNWTAEQFQLMRILHAVQNRFFCKVCTDSKTQKSVVRIRDVPMFQEF